MIGSLENPDSGSVKYFDKDKIYYTSKHFNYIRKNYISYIFQNFALIQSKTVLGNLMFTLKESRLTKIEKAQKINSELNKMNLQDKINSYIYELSGGQQQKIALIRAIIKPHTIILSG
ncbi:MAG: ATP-binding cassette domain-containing protein [Bacilli bacterium]